MTHYKEGEPRGAANLPISTPLDNFGPGLTRQEDLASSDINNIMRKYEKTGLLPVANREAFFADVSNVGDFRTATELVHNAENAFMELPAEVRSRFKNDASLFLDFTSDPNNREELVAMGLIEGVEIDTEEEAAAIAAAKKAEREAETASE